MARGGYRAGAGRKAGPARKSKEAAGAEATLGASMPGTQRFADAEAYLMELINDAAAPVTERSRAAIALLPYQKPKLAEVASGKKDVAKARADDASTQGRRFAPPPPPTLIVNNK